MGKVILELTTEQLNQLQACVMDARLYYKLEARQDQRDATMKITEVEDWEDRCKESAARRLVEADQATVLLEYLRDGWRIKRDDGPVVGGTPGKMYTDHGADEIAAPAVEAPERRGTHNQKVFSWYDITHMSLPMLATVTAENQKNLKSSHHDKQ